jgi:GR25 family glycosyltransferase involved in LPS biosynthesis
MITSIIECYVFILVLMLNLDHVATENDNSTNSTITSSSTSHTVTCQYTNIAAKNAPEVYYINMDRSIHRKVAMEKHLDQIGIRYFRVRGMTPSEIYIPADIEDTWRTVSCKLQTSWQPPNKIDSSYNISSSPYLQYTAYTAAVCGRGKGRNTPGELGCTASHLVAMHQAIYSTTAKSRYALIIEDDVYFPFDIDFQAMAMSAPDDFGILQLFNSNEASMRETWERYVKNPSYLWVKRHPIKFFDFWSTCAYLIDRFVMKPIIDTVYKVTYLMLPCYIYRLIDIYVTAMMCQSNPLRYIDGGISSSHNYLLIHISICDCWILHPSHHILDHATLCYTILYYITL